MRGSHVRGIEGRQQQIPCGNDRKKSKDNGKGKRRSFDFTPVGRFAQDDIFVLICWEGRSKNKGNSKGKLRSFDFTPVGRFA